MSSSSPSLVGLTAVESSTISSQIETGFATFFPSSQTNSPSSVFAPGNTRITTQPAPTTSHITYNNVSNNSPSISTGGLAGITVAVLLVLIAICCCSCRQCRLRKAYQQAVSREPGLTQAEFRLRHRADYTESRADDERYANERRNIRFERKRAKKALNAARRNKQLRAGDDHGLMLEDGRQNPDEAARTLHLEPPRRSSLEMAVNAAADELTIPLGDNRPLQPQLPLQSRRRSTMRRAFSTRSDEPLPLYTPRGVEATQNEDGLPTYANATVSSPPADANDETSVNPDGGANRSGC